MRAASAVSGTAPYGVAAFPVALLDTVDFGLQLSIDKKRVPSVASCYLIKHRDHVPRSDRGRIEGRLVATLKAFTSPQPLIVVTRGPHSRRQPPLARTR